MKTWKLVLGVALVFLLGALAGSIGTRFYAKHRYASLRVDPKAEAAFIMKRLSKELDLTENQKIRIGPIVEQTEQRLHDYFAKRRPEVDTIIEDSISEVKKELSDDQKKRLDTLREKFKSRRQAGKGLGFPRL